MVSSSDEFCRSIWRVYQQGPEQFIEEDFKKFIYAITEGFVVDTSRVYHACSKAFIEVVGNSSRKKAS